MKMTILTLTTLTTFLARVCLFQIFLGGLTLDLII